MENPAFKLSAATTLGTYLGAPIDPDSFVPVPPIKDMPKDSPIFLDTNVLLGYYQMPLDARAVFYQWLLTRKGYAADQVQREFKRHAQKLQRIHRRQLQAPIDPTRLTDSIEELGIYLQQQARLLHAYPSWQQELEDLLAEAEALVEYSAQYSQRFLKQGHDLLRQANQHSPLKVLQTLPAIHKREYKQLKREFDQAAALAIQEQNKGFDDAVAAYQYRHPNRVFPGLGDVLGKQKNPYGDYLIYHEILKWAAQDQGTSPVFFLTDDSTKGDWLDARGAPYPHYQQHFLNQTGRVLHLSAARPLLEKWIKVDTTTLLTAIEVQEDVETAIWHKNELATMQPITIKNVKALLKRLWPNRAIGDMEGDWQETIEYMQEASPYQSLFHLEGQLLRSYPRLIQQTIEQQQPYNQLEALKKAIAMPF